jgi:SAM-dependent methyltransferase
MQSDQFRLTFHAELFHWWFVARRRILRDLIAEVLPPSRETVIVDVGCATGGNASRLADEYTCVGVEPSGEALRLARSRPSRARFIHGAAPEDLGPWADRARLFLVADVLEHVADDAGLLRRLVERAAEGAYLLLTVPADRSQWSLHDESHGHLRRYDREGFAALWSALPVETLLVSHFNARLYPMVKLVRAVNRWRGRSFGASGTDLSIPPRPINRLLERVLRGEGRVLCDLLHRRRAEGYRRGVSLVALLRKTPSTARPAAAARPAARAAPVDRPRVAVMA